MNLKLGERIQLNLLIVMYVLIGRMFAGCVAITYYIIDPKVIFLLVFVTVLLVLCDLVINVWVDVNNNREEKFN